MNQNQSIMASKATRKILEDEYLSKRKDTLLKIAEVIDEVLEGNISIANACKKRSLNYFAVRRLLLLKVLDECNLGDTDLVDIDHVYSIDPDPYERVYIDVFKNDMRNVVLPFDYKETVIELVNKLPPRYNTIMNEYYGLNEEIPMPAIDIGEKYNVTEQRIDQIRQKSLKMLRAQKRVLIKGISKVASDEKDRVRNKSTLKDTKEEVYSGDLRDIRIEDIYGISTRTVNMLLRGKIYTLDDIKDKSDKKLSNIRGLGETVIKEIHQRIDPVLYKKFDIIRPQ